MRSHLAGSQIWLNLSFLWTITPIWLNDNNDPKKIDLGFVFFLLIPWKIIFLRRYSLVGNPIIFFQVGNYLAKMDSKCGENQSQLSERVLPIKASNKKTKAKPLLPSPPNPNLSLSCAEAAAGAAWLLSDCTDTCAYAPRCLPALAELRKNLLLLPPTAANNSNNYTQWPTKEDAPTHTTKKEKNPNKQSKYINESLLLLLLRFCFCFCLFFLAQQQQQQLQKRLSIALPAISSK